ncbi:hypothetical protein BOTBODRAFT_196914 [Botryobasidium botryosum FD-172 SS1]|uniref:Uncharacterized protein n=1 Tax=Botryobasidium botryosum (strain FD-172 SS1) TaxID=930990 RepID=A0A067N2T0_BOTB1|nr:hypothetical protein BOTBODRAFT_196914 [Botryobasidium botryosum FD-172 SS1]
MSSEHAVTNLGSISTGRDESIECSNSQVAENWVVRSLASELPPVAFGRREWALLQLGGLSFLVACCLLGPRLRSSLDIIWPERRLLKGQFWPIMPGPGSLCGRQSFIPLNARRDSPRQSTSMPALGAIFWSHTQSA